MKKTILTLIMAMVFLALPVMACDVYFDSFPVQISNNTYYCQNASVSGVTDPIFNMTSQTIKNVTIDGQNYDFNSTDNWDDNMFCYNNDCNQPVVYFNNLTLKNFNVYATNPANHLIATAAVGSSSNVTIENNILSGGVGLVLRLYQSSTGGASEFRLRNNTIIDGGGQWGGVLMGQYFSGAADNPLYIEDNVITNTDARGGMVYDCMPRWNNSNITSTQNTWFLDSLGLVEIQTQCTGCYFINSMWNITTTAPTKNYLIWSSYNGEVGSNLSTFDFYIENDTMDLFYNTNANKNWGGTCDDIYDNRTIGNQCNDTNNDNLCDKTPIEYNSSNGNEMNCTNMRYCPLSNLTCNSLTNDTISPVISWTTINFTSNATSFLIEYNATDETASTLNCSVYVNGTLNQTDDNVTSGATSNFTITGQDETNYSLIINCSDGINTNISTTGWVYISLPDTTAPVISWTTINFTSTSENFSTAFNVTDNKASTLNCSLLINGSINQTNASVLPAVTSYFYFWNITNGTNITLITINCSDGTNTDETTEGWAAFIEIPTPSFTLQTGTCPATTAGVLTLSLIVFISMALITLGMVFRLRFIGVIGGMLLMAISWVIVACYNMAGWVCAGSGLLLIVWFAVKK